MVDHEIVAEELEAAVSLIGVQFSFDGVNGFDYDQFHVFDYIFDTNFFLMVILIDIFLKLLKV